MTIEDIKKILEESEKSNTGFTLYTGSEGYRQLQKAIKEVALGKVCFKRNIRDVIEIEYEISD